MKQEARKTYHLAASRTGGVDWGGSSTVFLIGTATGNALAQVFLASLLCRFALLLLLALRALADSTWVLTVNTLAAAGGASSLTSQGDVASQ